MDNVYPLLGEQRPEPTLVDHRGREMHLFTYSYRHEGAEYSFRLWAWSHRDAKRRLRSIRRGLELGGKVHAKGDGIPASAVEHP